MEAATARDYRWLLSDRVDSAAARHAEALEELARAVAIRLNGRKGSWSITFAQQRAEATGRELEAALEVALDALGDGGTWSREKGSGARR